MLAGSLYVVYSYICMYIHKYILYIQDNNLYRSHVQVNTVICTCLYDAQKADHVTAHPFHGGCELSLSLYLYLSISLNLVLFAFLCVFLLSSLHTWYELIGTYIHSYTKSLSPPPKPPDFSVPCHKTPIITTHLSIYLRIVWVHTCVRVCVRVCLSYRPVR